MRETTKMIESKKYNKIKNANVTPYKYKKQLQEILATALLF